MTPDPEIKYVTWRNGRPRFMPSPSLRKLDYVGEDLKNADGSWMSAGQCLEWSREFERQVARHKASLPKARKQQPKKARTEPVPLTRIYPVHQLFQEYLHPLHNPGIADLAEKTTREYRYKTVVIEEEAPDIWQAEVEALDREICRGLYDTLRIKRGLNTAHGTMRVLGTAIEWAMSRGKLRGLQINPAHKLKMKTPPPRLRVGSIAEINHYVATADAMGWHEIGDMITLGVWSGQRQADRLLLMLAGEEDGRFIFRQEKTGAIVKIKKAPELVDRLTKAQTRRREKGIKSDLVIVNERGQQPFQPSYYSHRLLDIRKAAATTMPSIRDLRDQDFRDTAVTWLARAECTPFEIASITGHSFATVMDILKHYLALDDGMSDRAIEKMVTWYEKQRA
ncbi:hypothetical protein [Rhizobium tumorigenes]|uniref:hypothetical protein n=1 Tax=Rhizobium tumorigenes TaxID=2041385 RepID=UPI00241F73B2|nr:hypothetical protein [Rhizobium tumorigenes]WFS02183.1 hypothetical protein PR016_06105 [Rhizobium tumorigenes]